MSVLGIFIIIIGIGSIIFVHELGHFLFAKRVGVRVEVFSLGFGPRLFGFRKGETEYKVCAIPLGGYVKLAGGEQVENNKQYESFELPAKSVFERFQIFFAGSLMNFLFAFPLGILAFLVGFSVPGTTVGNVSPDTQEWHSGVRMGDTIVAINDKEIKSFEQYKKTVLRASVGETLKVKVLRNGKELTFDLVAKGSKSILPITDYGCIVEEINENSSSYRAGLRKGDEILMVNGRRVITNRTLSSVIMEKPEEEINLIVLRKNISGSKDAPAERKEISFKLERKTAESGGDKVFYKLKTDELYLPQLDKVSESGPAGMAGFVKDDIVISVNGEKVRNWPELSKKVRSSPGKELAFSVLRAGKEITLKAVPYESAENQGMMDFTLKFGNVAAEPSEDSPFSKAGLKGGDVITHFNGEPAELIAQIPEYFESNSSVRLTVLRDNKSIELNVTPVEKEYDYKPIVDTMSFHITFMNYGIVDSVTMGISDTLDWSLMTFQILWKLVKGDESPKDLAGPIGIFRIAYKTIMTEEYGRFFWFLMLICVNLAVVNMLPIPIMDGGLIMFLIIEKIKGKPVSDKTMAIAQYAGLVMVVALFLYVSYRDVLRPY